ncbi:MAG TPA: NAD(P)/FAD-dependent oxidoreductase [Bryobacteraceae bacterium]|jgi:NADH dehydrogenase|nr:NAD(P)/FAD-dependent oxidoreductase [Bryobacteraceae bacterium]
MPAHRVVILGGGFGGLYAAQALKKAPVDLTLVDRRNFHLFQPLLYQVATGTLSPGEIAAPLRSVLSKQKNATVLLGEAVDLDAGRKHLILSDGEVPYDTLIVATGSRTYYFGRDEWENVAPGLKTIEEATEIRHRILYAFEAAERERDPEKRQDWLTFVVVGAGPTGVELAGALGEIANDTLRHDFRSIRPQEARILLLDGSDRVLPPFSPRLSAKAEAQLIRIGVRPRTGVKVVDMDEAGVTVESPQGRERIASRTVIWAAGVHASPFGEVLALRAGAKRERNGQVAVEKDLSLVGHPEIFVIGDLARVHDAAGKPLPGVSPVAMQEGAYVARVIRERLAGRPAPPPFHYFNKGQLAVIGRGAAVADIGRFKVSGVLAWFIWLFVHLMYIVEFSSRVLIFIEWGFLYLTFNRGARLITGRNRLLQTVRMPETADSAATAQADTASR